MKKRNRSNDAWRDEASSGRTTEEPMRHPNVGAASESGGVSDAVMHQYGEPVRFVGTYRSEDSEQTPWAANPAVRPRGAAPDCRAQDFGSDGHVDDGHLINPEADQWPLYEENRPPVRQRPAGAREPAARRPREAAHRPVQPNRPAADRHPAGVRPSDARRPAPRRVSAAGGSGAPDDPRSRNNRRGRVDSRRAAGAAADERSVRAHRGNGAVTRDPRRSAPSARRRKPKLTSGQIAIRVLSGFLIFLFLVAAGLFFIWRYIIGAAKTGVTQPQRFITNQSGETYTTTTQPVQIRDGKIINILLMGLDLQQGGEAYSRSDTMMLATIDQNKNKIKLTSFQRDMLVFLPGESEPVKLNAASQYGPQMLIDTLNQTFKLDIQDYIMFDISGAEDVIDAVGGVDVDIPDDQDVIDYMNRLIEEQNAALNGGWDDENRSGWSEYIWESGEQHLNGRQAIAYARMRELDSDFQRMGRQQEIVEKVYHKMMGSNPITMANVIRSAMSHVTTNMTDIELTQMGITLIPKLSSSIAHAQVPLEGYYWMAREPAWTIQANFNLMIPILHQYIYGKTIGAFTANPLVPYTPLAETPVAYVPDEAYAGEDVGVPYVGSAGYAGGDALNGENMVTEHPSLTEETEAPESEPPAETSAGQAR